MSTRNPLGRQCPHRARGFTLAELLIALAILGVIATFTIPKVLQAQQDGRSNALAKEMAGTLTGALRAHQAAGKLTGTTQVADLVPYLNYMAIQTVGAIDNLQLGGGDTQPCAPVWPCIRFPNGTVLRYTAGDHFAGSANTNAIRVLFDPDGIDTPGGTTATAPNRAVGFRLYFDGRITTVADAIAGADSNGPFAAEAANTTPYWFSWER